MCIRDSDYPRLDVPDEYVRPGDVIFVLPGIYPQFFCFTCPKEVKYIGTRAENTIIDGSGIWWGIGVPNNIVISGFTITNAGWLELSQKFAFNVVITGNIIKTSGRGLLLWGASNIEITNNIINSYDAGIEIVESSGIKVKNNLIYGHNRGISIETVSYTHLTLPTKA